MEMIMMEIFPIKIYTKEALEKDYFITKIVMWASQILMIVALFFIIFDEINFGIWVMIGSTGTWVATIAFCTGLQMCYNIKFDNKKVKKK